MIDTHLLQPGDVLLVSGKGLVSRCIQWCTDSKWSHVAIYVGGGRQAIIEAIETGVVVNPVTTLVKGHKSLCVRRYPGLTVEQAEIIKDKAYALTYQAYDKWQLVTLGVYSLLRKVGIKWSSLVSNSRTRLICSEVVGVCYENAGIGFMRRMKMNTPESLYQTELLQTIYEAPL